eukprot:gene6320-4549_t
MREVCFLVLVVRDAVECESIDAFAKQTLPVAALILMLHCTMKKENINITIKLSNNTENST